MKLNRDQKKLTADILGNIAVGWFLIGIATPVFTQGLDNDQKITSIILGSVFSIIFYLFAIYLLRRYN